MNSKKIEINQSSLLGLKAELLRKKNEVSSAKYSQQINPAKISTKKFITKLDKTNEGVHERDKRDAEEFQEECDELKKSQKILEAKAKLYDKLVSNVEEVDPEVNVSGFLVDFKQKNNEEKEQSDKIPTEQTEKVVTEVESDIGEYSDEDDWVDFVDCLGRTKRCHKDDLQAMKKQDEKLRISLHGDDKVKEKEEESMASVQLPQLCSEDMKREILRQKWEEQERNLLEKKNVHYQDVLFDEARTHGVGYYGFSTDEAERAKQQEELKKLRKETEKQQAETQTAAQRKQKQMAERLKAARRRKRERLGLPPEEDDDGVDEEKESEVQEPKPEPVEELRRDIRKPGPIRPWDIGKEKTPKILTQDEWIEKKRSERIDEFAPIVPQPREKPKKRPYQKKEVYPEPSFSMEPEPIDDELEEKIGRRGVGAEIPPPPTFEIYGPTSKPKRNFSNMSQAELDKSIEEGLNFLRRQVEAKQAKRREEIDIM